MGLENKLSWRKDQERLQIALSISEKQISNNYNNHIKSSVTVKGISLTFHEMRTALGVANATG